MTSDLTQTTCKGQSELPCQELHQLDAFKSISCCSAFICAASGGCWTALQLKSWVGQWTGEEGGREGGKRESAGLVVYQVSNTEANELPGLSGLASRQRSVARIHKTPATTTLLPPLSPCFFSSLFSSFPSLEQHPIFSSFHLSRATTPFTFLLSTPPCHPPQRAPSPTPLPSHSCCTRSFSINCKGIERQVPP